MLLGEPHVSIYPYAFVNRMLEVETRGYCEQYNTKWTSVIPVNIYGPHDKFDLEKSHFLGATTTKVLTARKEIVVWGNGKQTRSFLYIDECIEAGIKEFIFVISKNKLNIKKYFFIIRCSLWLGLNRL